MLAIGGLNGAEAVSTSEVSISNTETTLATLSSPLPAGDNAVIALCETKVQDTHIWWNISSAREHLPSRLR